MRSGAVRAGGTPAGSLGEGIRGVSIATADVRPGDLWVGLPGARTHGARYARRACEQGAVAVLTDAEGVRLLEAEGGLPVPVLVVDRVRETLGRVSALVYGTSAMVPQLYGVTGTNGKTSTVHMLHGLLERLGVRAALSSTVERRFGGDRVVSGLTTPEANDAHALLAVMRERGVQAAALEVSAQALTRHRVDGVRFDVVGFTNLSHDHLDDYADMESYFLEKLRLFTPAQARRGVVSLETDWGRRLVVDTGIPVVTVGTSADADWRLRILSTDASGTGLELREPATTSGGGRTIRAFAPVPGAHMAGNLALALVMLLEGGTPFELLVEALAHEEALPRIPGRLENVSSANAPALYVDFGHSAEAFRHTLAAVRQLASGRVLMVFGADGDRDASKRVAMAEEAVRGSDVLIVTDHHPRFEDPASIRSALARAALEAEPGAQVHVMSPPPAAIDLAVSLARPGDAIVWAGPGHQNYRDIRGVRTRYSAREEAKAALRAHGYAD